MRCKGTYEMCSVMSSFHACLQCRQLELEERQAHLPHWRAFATLVTSTHDVLRDRVHDDER